MRLFHYHLVASRLRDVESEYLHVGFGLVGRYGSVGGEPLAIGASLVRFLPGGPSGRPRFEAEIPRAAS